MSKTTRGGVVRAWENTDVRVFCPGVDGPLAFYDLSEDEAWIGADHPADLREWR